MSVRDIVFPVVLTFAVISTNYKTAVFSSSKLIILAAAKVQMPVIVTQEPSNKQKPKPSCGTIVCS